MWEQPPPTSRCGAEPATRALAGLKQPRGQAATRPDAGEDHPPDEVDAGVVDQDLDRAEPRGDVRDRGGHHRAVADVHREAARAGRPASWSRGRRPALEVTAGDPCASQREVGDDRSTDTTCRTPSPARPARRAHP